MTHSNLFVVETDDNAFVGRIETCVDTIIVRNGFRGHPVIIDLDDVVEITLAEEHPLVEVLAS